MACLVEYKGFSNYYISWRQDGQPRKRSTGCPLSDRIGAEIKLREFNEHLEKFGRPPGLSASKLTFDQLVLAFYSFQLSTGITKKQASSNRMRILRLCETAGIKSISRISESRIQAALAKLRCKPASPKTKLEQAKLASPRTRNTYRKSLLAFLNWATREGHIKSNPLVSLKCENEEVDVRHRRTAYTDQEFVLLYNSALASDRVVEGFDGPTRAFAYLLSAYTGLRKSELGSLTTSSFHFELDQAYIVVEAACSKRRRRDTVPLPMHLVGEIQHQLRKLEPGAHLFPRLKFRKSHKMIRLDLEATGHVEYQTSRGEYRDWHALRHTAITRAWRTGAAPHIIKELARHSDFRLTMRYSHASSRELQDAANAIPNLLEAPQ